jgi:hypothetical protein
MNTSNTQLSDKELLVALYLWTNDNVNQSICCLMCRHEWKLAPEQRINLYQYLEYYPVLKAT